MVFHVGHPLPRSTYSHEDCNIDTLSGIFSAKGRTPKSKIAPLVSLTPSNTNDVGYFVSLELVDRALERLEIFPRTHNANLPLKSATSAAKMYRPLAIKCVRSHPRFSYRHADTFDNPVSSQKRCNDIGGRYSGGTVFCALVEELCEFMSAKYRLVGLKIAVLAISPPFAAYQIQHTSPG